MESHDSRASQFLTDWAPTTPTAPVPELAGPVRDCLEKTVSAGEAASGQWVGVLRRLCATKLRRLGMDRFMDDASLLVSELVTNGLRHGEGDGALRFGAVFTSSQVLIAVNDRSPTRPVIRAVTEDSESGRGFHIVSALANSWGVTPDGTTTWAVLGG